MSQTFNNHAFKLLIPVIGDIFWLLYKVRSLDCFELLSTSRLLYLS